MKKIFVLMGVIFLVVSNVSIRKINAQAFDLSISPYCSAYVRGEKASIVRRNTIYDFSGYNGDQIGVTDEYIISSVSTDAVLEYPVLAKLSELDKIEVTIDGEEIKSKILYGDKPLAIFGEYVDIQSALTEVYSPELDNQNGILYEFSGLPEVHFVKRDGQSVFFGMANRYSYDGTGYTISGSGVAPYRIFSTGGELAEIQSDITYAKKTISYREFVDFYAIGLFEDMVETEEQRIKEYLYSRFNKYCEEKVVSLSDWLGSVDGEVLCLLQIPLPLARAKVVCKGFAKPMKNGAYKPTTYTVRTLTAYPQVYPYTVQIRTTACLPYVVEGKPYFKNGFYETEHIEADSYFVISSSNAPQIKKYGQSDGSKQTHVEIVIALIGAVMGIFFIGFWLKKRKNG
ncbi:MAG: hypothetical protein IJX88_05890 [Clostridia bacterium]|nr:hypothetical protein [Clostridia bacterium]